MGVTSAMLVIFSPQLLSARTADSRPGPGPPTRTSTFFTPCSWAATPAFSAATCAANGVLLREPRKPQPPAVAQESVLPCRSVMVMIVLLRSEVHTSELQSRRDLVCRLLLEKKKKKSKDMNNDEEYN